jgi:hypothetical protein
LPEGWRINEIAQAAHPAAIATTTYVLAWKRLVDDRPVLTEECLVLADLGRERWVLSSVHRQQGRGWEIEFGHMGPGYKGFPQGAWVPCTESFTQRPSNKEVYRFTDGYMWLFWVTPGGQKVHDAQVCKRTWEEVLKEKPTRDFTKDK